MDELGSPVNNLHVIESISLCTTDHYMVSIGILVLKSEVHYVGSHPILLITNYFMCYKFK